MYLYMYDVCFQWHLTALLSTKPSSHTHDIYLYCIVLYLPGAVVAREYGLPCVVNMPRAVSLFKTGKTWQTSEGCFHIPVCMSPL